MRISCTVCYEMLESSEDVSVAPCGHLLHMHCWTLWLDRTKNCPDCRQPTNDDQLIKLFFNPEDGDDYLTLSNKYDALRCDLSCKIKDYEAAEAKMKILTQETASLRDTVQKLKTENEELKKKSGNFPPGGSSGSVILGVDMYKSLLKSKIESDSAALRSQALAEEVTRLRKKAEDLEKSKKANVTANNSSKQSEADTRKMKTYENIMINLKNCLNDYEDLKKNSNFLKSLKAYTDQIDSISEIWDDMDEDPEKYIDLFKDVKKYFELKQKRKEELRHAPRGCVLSLSGIPKVATIEWQDIRAAVEYFGGNVAFITFNPGDTVAYVRLENCYPGEVPAIRFVRNMNGVQIKVQNIDLEPKALEYNEEKAFLKKSLEDRDLRNRERFRMRKGLDYDDAPEKNTLLDCSMQMVAECSILI